MKRLISFAALGLAVGVSGCETLNFMDRGPVVAEPTPTAANRIEH